MKKVLMVIAAMCFPLSAGADPAIHSRHIVTPARQELTRQYSLLHYGHDSFLLKDHKMIVIHYTVTQTFDETVRLFSADTLEKTRPELTGGGKVNTGIHYIIEKNGTIHSLIPDTMIARHIIGFNHKALGIELIGMNSRELTKEQLKSCAWLVSYLVKKYPDLQYLVGHHEYMVKTLPHFRLYTALDKSYKPTVKIDPGKKFMENLRAAVKNLYGIQLQL